MGKEVENGEIVAFIGFYRQYLLSMISESFDREKKNLVGQSNASHSLSLSLLFSQSDPMPPNKMTALTVHLPFVGFTFTNNSRISDNPPVAGATGDSPDSSEVTMIKTENNRLHREVDALKKQLANKTIAESPLRTGDGEGVHVIMGQPLFIWVPKSH